ARRSPIRRDATRSSDRRYQLSARAGSLAVAGVTVVAVVALLALVLSRVDASNASADGSVVAVTPPTVAEIGQAPTSTSPETTSTPTGAASPATTTAAAAPGCRVVTYTPPTASGAETGELCVPSAPSHGVTVILVHGGGGSTGDRSDLNAW